MPSTVQMHKQLAREKEMKIGIATLQVFKSSGSKAVQGLPYEASWLLNMVSMPIKPACDKTDSIPNSHQLSR